MYNHLLRIPAKRHQVFGVNYALEHHWSVNGYPMGHGKTLCSIIITLHTKLKTLVICPAFLKINWHREYDKFSKKKLKIKILYSKELKTFKPSDEDVIIINYDIISRAKDLFKWSEFVSIDESHYLGNPSAKRTKEIFKQCMEHGPERVLLLSGSPIRGRVGQWYVPIKLTGNNPKGTSGVKLYLKYTAFQDNFCLSRMVSVGSRMFKKFFGIQNEKELQGLLKGKFLRKCPDYELELPKLSFEEIDVDYNVDDSELLELFEDFQNKSTLSDSLASAKKSNALSKVPFTFKFVKNIIDAGEGPVAVYSDHVVPLDELSILFKKAKITSTIINGSTPLDKRQQYIDDFQEGKTDVFEATIGAASTGITITKANKFVFNDESWINTENEQAYKRIHRISQTKDCIVYSIRSGPVDRQIAKINKEKDIVVMKSVDFNNLELWQLL